LAWWAVMATLANLQLLPLSRSMPAALPIAGQPLARGATARRLGFWRLLGAIFVF